MGNPILVQGRLEKPLDVVLGCQVYIDMLLDFEFFELAIIKGNFINKVFDHYINLEKTLGKKLDEKKRIKLHCKAELAIKIGLLHKYDNSSLDVFCRNLGAMPAYQKFLGLRTLFGTKIPSRSTINELENSMPTELLSEFNVIFMKALFDKEHSKELGFKENFNLNHLFYDSTCFKANIHYPVDYIFFKDLVRTMMLGVGAIRDKGIKIKMNLEPSKFESKMNHLCMEMSSAYRVKDAKKKRKGIFREMRDLANNANNHAVSHFNAFNKTCEKDGCSGRDLQILSDIKAMIDFTPKVIDLAKRRILDEEIIPNEDKFFSLYEHEINIIKRHKDGAKYEFGNSGYIVEQQDGFIVTADLLEKSSPGDAKLIIKSLDNILNNYGLTTVESICGDRGCDSKDTSKAIAEINEKHGLDILNAIASKNVHKLMEQLKDENIREALKRRSSTEARIALLKIITNNPMRQKGIANRRTHFSWAILSHNIFKAARMLRQQVEVEKNTRKSA